jgi:hypothetical protein
MRDAIAGNALVELEHRRCSAVTSPPLQGARGQSAPNPRRNPRIPLSPRLEVVNP